MKTITSILCGLLLASCSTDRNAGIAAAKLMGEREYVIFPKDGHYDTACVFQFRGHSWMYHHSIGSFSISDEHVKELRERGFMLPVLAQDKCAVLPNGCLPQAIADVRKHGGHVVLDHSHAYRVP